MADAELDDRGLSLGAYAEDGERDAELVVEILLSAQGVEPPREDAGDHLLGGGLARTARDADDGDLHGLAAARGEPGHGLGHVGHGDDRAGDALGHPLREAAGRAGFERGGDELVPVAPCAGQGAEHQPGRDLAVVPHSAGHRALRPAAVERAAGVFRDLCYRHVYHAYFSIEASIILWQSSA